MHYLHCILVHLEENIVKRLYSSTGSKKPEAIAEAIRYSESEVDLLLERYENEVYDWYSFGSDGNWDEDVPPIVLGYEKPDLLIQYVNEYSKIPLTTAKCLLKGFYSMLADRGEKTPILLDDKLIDKLWTMDFGAISPYWGMDRAIRLVCWDYLSESCFYSIPDGAAKISEGILKDVAENPGAYCVVFVDIHS